MVIAAADEVVRFIFWQSKLVDLLLQMSGERIRDAAEVKFNA